MASKRFNEMPDLLLSVQRLGAIPVPSKGDSRVLVRADSAARATAPLLQPGQPNVTTASVAASHGLRRPPSQLAPSTQSSLTRQLLLALLRSNGVGGSGPAARPGPSGPIKSV